MSFPRVRGQNKLYNVCMYKNIKFETILTMIDNYLLDEKMAPKHKEILITIKHILELKLRTSFMISHCINSFEFPRSTFYKYINIIIHNKPLLKQSNRPKNINTKYD